MAPQPENMEARLEPCASTASFFLYTQGSVILCLHHDTLAIERRFERHQEKIAFIAVDNVTERGSGRLVISYDVGQTAIVWDLFTGTEVACFTTLEPLTVAAWMRNGNIAFGNCKGDIILFEPASSEHMSVRTTDDPITALAPGSDCRTYAIGYQSGSILLATLQPTFTVLHTITSYKAPSPIISLTWHASSSKQKSDMLATQALNGDLRVWSVAKPPSQEPPRAIRILKRSDLTNDSPKWISWSKNGKIIQYLNKETWSWDVRTKHVSYEPIPTVEGITGIACYGPGATLFTLGPQYTVQQYDLENPALVANVQHLPPGLQAQPSPVPELHVSEPTVPEPAALEPTALESTVLEPKAFEPKALEQKSLKPSPDLPEPSPSGRQSPAFSHMSEAARHQLPLRSPYSVKSHVNSLIHNSKASVRSRNNPYSPISRSGQSGTTFSTLSRNDRNTIQQTTTSIAYASSISGSSSSMKSPYGPSRLRNEVHFSPVVDHHQEIDLFPYTRARLIDVPYRQHWPMDETNLTPDNLRQQMLGVVFGWDGDIEDLIRNELSHHPKGSQSAILLACWLGESDTNQMVSMLGPGPVTVSDWMLLALSQMTGQTQANKVGQAFVQKLLEAGNVHVSATVLLGLGDRNDAIEVYVSQNYFLEAILLTCLVTPTDWLRQSHLVRRWGEHVVSDSQQQLAIRCFMCTGVEPSEPWTSPSAQQATTSFADLIGGVSPLASPEPPFPPVQLLTVPSSERDVVGPSMKGPSLKLITSFGSQNRNQFRFPGLKSEDRTPTNLPWVTPIAESVVGDFGMSPADLGAYRATGGRSGTSTPVFMRRRLASIGETPVDVSPPPFPQLADKKKVQESEDLKQQSKGEPLTLLTSARYEPGKEAGYRPSPQTAVQATSNKFSSIKGLPSPTAGIFDALKNRPSSRNSSSDRKPEGLHIRLPGSNRSSSSSINLKPSAEKGEEIEVYVDGRSPASSALNTGSTLNSGYRSNKSPMVVSGRSTDQYISSLDEAYYHQKKYQEHRRLRSRGRYNAEDAARRTHSQESRNRRHHQPPPSAKYSSCSSAQMSPVDSVGGQTKTDRSIKSRARSRSSKGKGRSSRTRTPSTRRYRSTSRAPDHLEVETLERGRSRNRDGSNARSPSSPLPLSALRQEATILPPTEQLGSAFRLVASDRERLRSRPRSRSHRPDKRTGRSPGGSRASSRSRRVRELDEPSEPERNGTAKPDGINNNSDEPTEKPLASSDDEAHHVAAAATAAPIKLLNIAGQRRKELAAAELEARRLSLTRNPSAPNIPFPGQLQSSSGKSAADLPTLVGSAKGRLPLRKSSPEYLSGSESSHSPRSTNGAAVGLPATPRAMRTAKNEEEAPSFPPTMPMSATFESTLAANTIPPDRIPRSMSVPMIEVQASPRKPLELPPYHPHYNPNFPRSRSASRGAGDSRPHVTSTTVTVGIGERMSGEISPPLLPELQHLKMPPPPPALHSAADSRAFMGDGILPPGSEAGMIEMTMDNEHMASGFPRAITASPAMVIDGRRTSFENNNTHRRGKSINETLSYKFRTLTDRMRTNTNTGARPQGTKSPEPEQMSFESVPQMIESRY
ncbi:hypothetical protein ASPZODRAFT_127108 [Penicilliopsis zonata CBS 506.65]|uniref:Gem-associated protein 5 TPR domain-containing protein n=1 Tax=Penicilliopsis zonata CBS 506.65 TaxID=1073090 RepID=A0A1L9SV51_9EURO|nr:hypothetical protein ASPZODRAFT_127108 [Penicilliopsis zonata CBS 506.65]OJJ51100.1 hypothetical protein ASPZODRAFT_127108 [Penicilliopsis zonata CBS 506.65]